MKKNRYIFIFFGVAIVGIIISAIAKKMLKKEELSVLDDDISLKSILGVLEEHDWTKDEKTNFNFDNDNLLVSESQKCER